MRLPFYRRGDAATLFLARGGQPRLALLCPPFLPPYAQRTDQALAESQESIAQAVLFSTLVTGGWVTASRSLPSPPVPSPPLPSRSGVLLGGVGTTEEVERYDLKTQVEGNLKKQSATKQGKHVKMKGGTNTCVFFLCCTRRRFSHALFSSGGGSFARFFFR